MKTTRTHLITRARAFSALLILGVITASFSAANYVQAQAIFQYTIATQNDPVANGQVLEFDATVTNLTASTQSVRLDFTVPQFTTYGGLVGGDSTFFDFGTVAAGGSETVKLRFVVVDNPPDGTVITLTVTDEARLVSVSKSAVVQSIPTLNLQLSTEQGTVAPGGAFTYTMATANLSASSLPGTKLNVPVPTGSTFVSADGGGVLSGGVVKWNFGTLAVGANVEVHATFRASTTGTPLGPLTSTVSDSNGDIARASDKRVVYSTPSFQYVLTATPDPVAPGQILEFDATVHNLTAATQSVRLDFTVPQYATYGGLVGGDASFFDFGTVAPGASETAKLRFGVVGSGAIPPDGTSITLNAIDLARGASISRTAVVRSFSPLTLQLSSEQGTVAPGKNFTYTLATANASGSSLSDVILTAAVPTGASFVSADGGGTLSGGIVTWNLGTLGAAANQQVHLTLRANSGSTPLGPLDAVVSDSNGDIARASDTRVIYAAPLFQYVLTAVPDPVAPGQILEFDATVHNLTAGTQSVRLDFTVPQYATYGGLVAGDATFFDFGTVAPGASETAKLRFGVVGSGSIPPDGTSITLNAIDLARGASISRSAVVRSVSALNLQLSTEQGTIAPGSEFTYTLATANVIASSLPGTILSATVPTGTSFVSADGGGTLNAGVVTWNLGTLAAHANKQVHLTLKANPGSTPLGPLDAVVSDTNGDVARASDIRVVYSAPLFQYVLTATPDPVAPGQILEFDATVHNLTAATQSVRLDFTVPQYATYGGLVGGDASFFDFGTVAPGASETAKLRFGVVGSGVIPPDGTGITLNAIDLARGASISRTAIVRAVPTLTLQLSTEQGTVAAGSNFVYTIATANASGASLPGAALSVAVPTGATFVSADGGGVLNGGVVTWTFGTLRAGMNTQMHVTFQASSTPNTPLGPIDAVASDSSGDIARASDARVVYALPLFQYTLTAIPDPAIPGQVLEYDATVTNLTTDTQSVRLDFTVPQYATYGGLVGGDASFFDFGTVAPGASETAKLRFGVVGSGSIPPDGTSITLNTVDLARGASVSRTAVVQSAPALNLQLSSQQGTVAPGGNFTYTLATANVSGNSLRRTVLAAAVPAGSSFISADHGGQLSNGVVAWNLGTLGANTNVQVHATFQASSTPNTPLGAFDAVVSDNAGHIARASDTRVVYAAPLFQYTLTATPDPVAPGQVLEYDATVTNLTATTQSVRLDFTVPEFTTFGGLVGGDASFFDFGTVVAGGSETAQLFFTVVGTGEIPPDGTSITLDTIDLARGASVSRTVVVDSGLK